VRHLKIAILLVHLKIKFQAFDGSQGSDNQECTNDIELERDSTLPTDMDTGEPTGVINPVRNQGYENEQAGPDANLIQDSKPVSASERINRTARDAYQGRALAPLVASTNSKVDDTVQPMDVTPAPVSKTSGWLNLVRTYEAEIAQRPDHVCISCGGLFYRSGVAGSNFGMIARNFGESFLTNVTPAAAQSTGVVCVTCNSSIKSGKIPKLCLSNGLAFPEVSYFHHTILLRGSPFGGSSIATPFLHLHYAACGGATRVVY